jgi:cell surface protein SprA
VSSKLAFRIFLLCMTVSCGFSAKAQAVYPFALVLSTAAADGDEDSTKLRYPIQDRRNDFVTDQPPKSIDLKDPKAISKKIEYDPITKKFIVYEKIGDRYIRVPNYMSYEEFIEYQKKESERDYFEMRSKARDLAERRSEAPKLYDGPELYDKGFGFNPKIEIRPQGNVDVTLGIISQKIDNPVLPLPQRQQTNFDFDMNIQMNLTGQIGDYMKLNTNFNTKATFNFENQVKAGIHRQ